MKIRDYKLGIGLGIVELSNPIVRLTYLCSAQIARIISLMIILEYEMPEVQDKLPAQAHRSLS